MLKLTESANFREEASIRVLMLGWEFPPLFAGGLGKACQGLSEALAKIVDLTLILPTQSLEMQLPHGHLTSPTPTSKKATKKTYITKKLRLQVPTTEIFPYPGMYKTFIKEEISEEVSVEEAIEAVGPAKLPPANPSEELLYGKGILKKLIDYAEGVSRAVSDLPAPDVIHAHDWVTFPAALALQQQIRKPLVLHIHSLETDRVAPEIRNKVFEIEYKAMKAADLIIAVSGYTRDKIVSEYRISVDKIFVVHNGIDPLATYSGPSEQKKEAPLNSPKKILFLGRLTRQKGPTFLVETAVLLLQKMPNLRFVVAGTGDGLRQVMQYAKEREVLHKFEFTGFATAEQAKQLLSESDVYFMPSVSEPFGLSALEAAQAGVPVVISKQSGVSEVLSGALTANFWDTKTFADHLFLLLNDDAAHQEMVRLNTQNISLATWERAAEDVMLHYSKLLAGLAPENA